MNCFQCSLFHCERLARAPARARARLSARRKTFRSFRDKISVTRDCLSDGRSARSPFRASAERRLRRFPSSNIRRCERVRQRVTLFLKCRTIKFLNSLQSECVHFLISSPFVRLTSGHEAKHDLRSIRGGPGFSSARARRRSNRVTTRAHPYGENAFTSVPFSRPLIDVSKRFFFLMFRIVDGTK